MKDTSIKEPMLPVDQFAIKVNVGYTLTYAENVEGWVSFYSYYPDWIIGMNNHLYTFKGGNLYRHNVNPLRNTFYENWWIQIGIPAGAFTETSLTSVFNDSAFENKLFKTINLEGDAKWEANLQTDLQYSGYISLTWFEKKEQSFFSFIRNLGAVPATPSQYALRSLNGIGRSYAVTPAIGTDTIDFSISPLVAIGSIVSIGDYLYFAVPPYDTPQLAGQVINIIQDYRSGLNQIVIDNTIPNAIPIPIPDAYFLYIKNSIAESHGVLGHYCVFNLTNDSTDKVELFAVETQIMKSFP